MRRERKKAVTLRDVAKRAGVSTAVVSYAINNGPRPISDEARARVTQAIAELGYYPNAFAQAMASRRTRTIGMIFQHATPSGVFGTPFFTSFVGAVASQLKARRYYLLIYPVEVEEPLSEVEELVSSQRLDGVIVRLVQDAPESDALLQAIADAHLPGLCIERRGDPRFGFGSITYDNRQAAHAATSYLIGRGHRRIAYLQGPLRAGGVLDRRAGYLQALDEAGIAADEALIAGNSWAPADATAAAEQILSSAAPPTAIFAANDTLAIAAMSVLRRRGLRVPDDVAVIGYDDTPVAAESEPPLTTIRAPLAEIGERAVTRILDMLSSQPAPSAAHEVIPTQFIRRASA
jgi:DNA-binding LacI/PurR family transcriptional regulator